jgi:hypothetical protein
MIPFNRKHAAALRVVLADATSARETAQRALVRSYAHEIPAEILAELTSSAINAVRVESRARAVYLQYLSEVADHACKRASVQIWKHPEQKASSAQNGPTP